MKTNVRLIKKKQDYKQEIFFERKNLNTSSTVHWHDFYEIDITTGRGKMLQQAGLPYVNSSNFLFNIGNDIYFEQMYKLSLN